MERRRNLPEGDARKSTCRLTTQHDLSRYKVSKDEWLRIKRRLFDLDRHAQPKVVVSVLMLREGFDVSNICIIVPLRATRSKILLEQTIGRGLRQMWREPEYADMKKENRKRILDEHQSPTNYIDILSIVEHPAFFAFYDELMKGHYAAEDEKTESETKAVGDMLTVPLHAATSGMISLFRSCSETPRR